MTQLSDLRSQVFAQAGGWCEWPGCNRAAEELAHIRHRGMGGNESANTPENVLAFCRRHHRRFDEARLSSSDVNDLLRVTRDGEGCSWPSCALPVTHRRSGRGTGSGCVTSTPKPPT